MLNSEKARSRCAESRFVRLTAIDENSSLEVSAVLASLRALQTSLDVAILVVHHARKSGGNGAAAGLALRGSGDLWAWGDSNLYLSRKQKRLQLAIEHRSAPTPEPHPLTERILEALRSAPRGRRLDDLRTALHVL